MPSLASSQSAFIAALTNPTTPVPDGIARPVVNGQKSATWKRFDVYRNNVMVTVVDALAETFPAVMKLVGDEFFRATARAYVEQHKPTSPLLFRFGDRFGDFLDDFPPVAERVAYLGDVARLEFARVQAYHARDVAPLELAALAQVAPDQVAHIRLTPHPALSLVRSRFPIVSLWGASLGLSSSAAVDLSTPEDALTVRPGLDVDTRTLPDGGGAFLAALLAGHTLGEAAGRAASEFSAFDLSMHLTGLFNAGTFQAIVNTPSSSAT